MLIFENKYINPKLLGFLDSEQGVEEEINFNGNKCESVSENKLVACRPKMTKVLVSHIREEQMSG
jgi:hypothetical protein